MQSININNKNLHIITISLFIVKLLKNENKKTKFSPREWWAHGSHTYSYSGITMDVQMLFWSPGWLCTTG